MQTRRTLGAWRGPQDASTCTICLRPRHLAAKGLRRNAAGTRRACSGTGRPRTAVRSAPPAAVASPPYLTPRAHTPDSDGLTWKCNACARGRFFGTLESSPQSSPRQHAGDAAGGPGRTACSRRVPGDRWGSLGIMGDHGGSWGTSGTAGDHLAVHRWRYIHTANLLTADRRVATNDLLTVYSDTCMRALAKSTYPPLRQHPPREPAYMHAPPSVKQANQVRQNLPSLPPSCEKDAGASLCVCFKAPRTYTPVLGALVSPLGTR